MSGFLFTFVNCLFRLWHMPKQQEKAMATGIQILVGNKDILNGALRPVFARVAWCIITPSSSHSNWAAHRVLPKYFHGSMVFLYLYNWEYIESALKKKVIIHWHFFSISRNFSKHQINFTEKIHATCCKFGLFWSIQLCIR